MDGLDEGIMWMDWMKGLYGWMDERIMSGGTVR